MEIVTLLENTACREDLETEHGLSLYIETGKHRILFDSGQSGMFARNARRLGVDLSGVDLAVLSHGHYDHGGGLQTFLECNDHAKIYANEGAFQPHWHGPEKYIGLDPGLLESGRIVPVGDFLRLDEMLTLCTCNHRPRVIPVDSFGLTEEQNGIRVPDPFFHEQYLLVEEQGKRILFSGCSHKGIRNIESWFVPDILVGGFHLKKLDPEGAGRSVLEETARDLLHAPTVYYTGHCTGQAQFLFLKSIMGDRLSAISTGSRLSF